MDHDTFENAVRQLILPFLPGFYIDDRIIINKPRGLLTAVYLCSPLGSQTSFSLYKNSFGELYFVVEGSGKLGPKYTSPLIVAVAAKERLEALSLYLRSSLAYLDKEKDISEKCEILARLTEMRNRSPEHLCGRDLLEFLDNLDNLKNR